MKSDLTYDYVSSRLIYNPESGNLFWKERPQIIGETKKEGSYRRRWNHRYAGKKAGCVYAKDRLNYRCLSIDGKTYYGHRIAWLLSKGEWPSLDLDHQDGDGLNNRIENLREASSQENGRNRRRCSTNTSGCTGVNFQKAKGKWRSAISVNGGIKHLGIFANFFDAVAARKSAERKYGYHTNHGRAT